MIGRNGGGGERKRDREREKSTTEKVGFDEILKVNSPLRNWLSCFIQI